MLRIADVCAGTGSLSAAVAAELGGHVVSVSDTSGAARRVLAARYPEAAVYEDALLQDLSRVDAVAEGRHHGAAGAFGRGFCGLLRVDDGYPALSRTARIRLAGNAVVQLQVRLALRLAAKELLKGERV